MRWRTWFRPNAEKTTITVFGVDDYAQALQSAATRLTHPASPQTQGTRTTFGASLDGDPYNGGTFMGVTGPVQSFQGASQMVQFAAGATGDRPGLPSTASPYVDQAELIAGLNELGIMA